MILTNKQKEIVEYIENKQKQMGKKLYLTYNDTLRKMFLIEIIDNTNQCNNIGEINTRVAYSLLDKNILVPEKINDSLSLVTLGVKLK